MEMMTLFQRLLGLRMQVPASRSESSGEKRVGGPVLNLPQPLSDVCQVVNPFGQGKLDFKRPQMRLVDSAAILQDRITGDGQPHSLDFGQLCNFMDYEQRLAQHLVEAKVRICGLNVEPVDEFFESYIIRESV